MTAAVPGNGRLPVDGTLQRIVVLFRLLGWGWMLLLVVMTPFEDAAANRSVTFGALGLATLWTAATLWATRRPGTLGTLWFAAGDFAVALVVGFASTIAGAADLFHGGYPMSALAVVAYALGLRWTIGGAVVLGLEQVVVHVVDGRGVIPAAGSVTFLVFGLLLGWGFESVRDQERRRLTVQGELDAANTDRVRHEERLALADRLHDSVLQTLAVMRRNADDAHEVRYLARRQERELRRTISEYRSLYADSTRAGIEAICDEIEDLHRIEIDAVIRGDAALDGDRATLLEATREALTNAAKHSGSPLIDLYAVLEADSAEIYVRDRGRGFDLGSAAQGGIDHGLRRRIDAIGGTISIRSGPGQGTDVALRWPGP